MTRFLILIFALNAFFTPVTAMGVCEMMDESNATLMSSVTDTMSEMNCDMDAGTSACSSLQCASDCETSTLSLILLSDNNHPTLVASLDQPHAGLVYFYTIFLPVNTPPPLV